MSGVAKVIASPFAAVTGMFKKPKMPKVQQPLPVPTRDDARIRRETNDELRRRRGSAANFLTGGLAGAEAAPAATATRTLLGA